MPAPSIWTIDGATVRVRVMIPTEAARQLAAKGAPTPGLATVASAVSQAFSVTTPAGDCEAVDQGEGVGQIYTLALTPGLDRFEMVFACPQGSGLVLKNDLLFGRDPGHIDYAQIRIGAGQPELAAFTRDQRSIALPATGRLHGVDPLAFGRMAAIRLATSLAALAILFGSVLLSRRWLDLAWLGTSLAAGYVASAGVALSGPVILDEGLASALLGLLAATLGLGALLPNPTRTETSPRWRGAGWAGVAIVGAGLVVVAALKSPAAGLASVGVAIFGLAAVQTSRLEPKLGGMVFAPAAAFTFMDGLGPCQRPVSAASVAEPSWPRSWRVTTWAGLAAAVVIAGIAMGLIWLAGLRLRALKDIGSEIGGAALIGLGLFGFVTRLYS